MLADRRKAEESKRAEAKAKEEELATEQAAAEKPAAQERAAAAAAATEGTLIVKADADCKLTVNGKPSGALLANQTKPVKVSAGEHLVECVSAEAGGARAQEAKNVAAGAQVVVVLALAEKIAGKQREAQQRAAAESAARAPGNLGLVDLGSGVLKDTKTGLEWTRSDNGSAIDWNGARNHCATRGGSWRLPSPDELLAIYDANVPSPKVCYQDNGKPYTCKVSHLFHLTGSAHWSGEANGSRKAFGVSLSLGRRYAYPVGASPYSPLTRALCVRRP